MVLKYNDTKHSETRKIRPLLCNINQIDKNLWIDNKYALDPIN